MRKSCVWNLTLGVHENGICFEIFTPCIPCSFKWTEFFQLRGSSTTFYVKCKKNQSFLKIPLFKTQWQCC